MNTSKIARYVWLGREDKDWYQDCRQVFVDLFGEARVGLVAKLFAATSINTSLKSNVRLFRRALWEIEHNKPVGLYLPNIRDQLLKVRKGEELSGRKISNFARAMTGDPLAVVVDIWVCRAFAVSDKLKFSPSDKQYSVIEEFIQHEAREMGLEPRQLCAMIWSGVRTSNGGDKQTRYTSLLRYQLTNLYNCI